MYADLIALGRTATSRHVFFRGCLSAIAEHFASPYAALYVRDASEVIQEDCHSGPTDPEFWKKGLQSFLTESLTQPGARAKRLNSKRGNTHVAFLGAPILDGSGAAIGALALVVARPTTDDVSQPLAVLDALAQIASHLAESLGQHRSSRHGRSADEPNQALTQAAESNSTEELAFAITNSLRNKLGCEQVAIGLVVRGRIEILSISGLDGVAAQSHGVIHIRSSMEECLDADKPIVQQAQEKGASAPMARGYRLHQRWQAAVNGDAIASIPLHAQNAVAAILTLRRRPDQPFTIEHIEKIQKTVEPYAAALLLTRRATRGLLRHTIDSIHSAKTILTGPGHRARKLAAAILAMVAGWFVFGAVPYTLTVPCTVNPLRANVVAVPFDGTLLTAAAVEGDRVTAGQVLCELDSRDLQQQRNELLAEIAVFEREKDHATAARDPAGAQLALARQELARTRLQIADSRLERSVIRAPFDGIVVAGDLRKQVGNVVTRGQALFEVAPLSGWHIQLEIPETDVDEVAAGMTGTFVPHARPETQQTFQVARVGLHAELRNERNVYIAEVDTHLPFAWMRAGMEGVAKVHAGRRPVWWVALHRAIDYVRLNVWS